MERGEGWNPDAHDVVHITQFTAEDFNESRNLKPMAVPTLFDMHENVKPQTCNNNGQSYTATCSDCQGEHHNYSNTSPRNLKHKLDCAKDNNFNCTCYPNQKEAYSTVKNEFPLHYYGPKAYECLATKFHLPSTRTLRRRFSKVDGSPSINRCMIQALKQLVQDKPEIYTNVACMIDAMAIRKKFVMMHIRQKWQDLSILVSKMIQRKWKQQRPAIVVLIVGLKGNWKAPIAYYCTNSISAIIQKQILLDIFSELHNVGMKVWSLTMDGHPVNFSTCELLGCKLKNVDSLETAFTDPSSGN
ncbi:DNA transposase THAP9 [Biomphalaria glabrata]|nr:DNA transposase THAP9 [Biomphalaria glabrata]